MVDLSIVFCMFPTCILFFHSVGNTSSTAQGGGGSFKNENPIGEVSCCDAKMAERTDWWIERWLSVSAFLSFSFAIYLQSYLSSHLPICVSIYVSIYLSVCLSIYLIISLFIYITSEPPTVARTYGVLYILTWKCASRHSGAPFFNIRTSKSGANMWCFVHFDLEMCFAPQRRTLFQHPNLQKWRDHVVFCTFWLGNVLRATMACTFSTSQLPKVVRTWCVLYILPWKCASRHKGVHFFNIRTSKSGVNTWCFVHFALEMCFAPQRRALFQHPNLQKWREHVVFCTFWLGNVLRATTACTFSTSQLPKVVRTWCVLYILTSKCASRHNGVHFFSISTSKSGPRMVCFVHFDFKMCFAPQRRALFRHRNFQKWSGPGVFCTFWLQNVLRATTACKFSSLIWPHGSAPAALASLLFDPPEPQIIGKNTVFRDFPTFSRICIFFLLTLSLLIFSLLIFLFSLPLPCSAFHLSILSEVWLLNFLRLFLTDELIIFSEG